MMHERLYAIKMKAEISVVLYFILCSEFTGNFSLMLSIQLGDRACIVLPFQWIQRWQV